jgi:NTP pyrophosphatase (non-canonical NTP hydrolase)
VTALERGDALIAQFQLGDDPASRALDLSSEVGEVCKEILKGTQYGARAFLSTPNLEMELGDAYLSLLTLASSVQVDLDLALEQVVAKMRDRLERNSQVGSNS